VAVVDVEVPADREVGGARDVGADVVPKGVNEWTEGGRELVTTLYYADDRGGLDYVTIMVMMVVIPPVPKILRARSKVTTRRML
jgi:hypothetical protein